MTAPAAPSRRLGVLVPSSNTTVEREFAAALPADISLHVGRLPLTRIAAQSIVEILRPLEEESRKLASADVDLILLGATAPSFMKGVGYDREVSGRIERASGKPATTTSTALLEALAAIGAKRVALAAAYDDAVNAVAAAGRRADRPEADALVLACTNWVSMAAIEPLEAELGKPVVSTTQASLWACLRRLGWTRPLTGAGRLLDRHIADAA